MNIFTGLIDGLSIGSIYAMIALGYTMVYGIVKMLNFAHGDIIMIGAFTVILFSTDQLAHIGLPYWLAFIIAIIVCALLGVVVERVAYKPLRNASSLAVLITAIGVSYFLQNVVAIITQSRTIIFPVDLSRPSTTLYITDNVKISYGAIITIVLTILITIGLVLFIRKTKTGKAMLAVSEDRDAAQLMGINVNKTISITFVIGSALAAVAGICFGFVSTSISATTGAMPGIKAFIAAVLGGIGSIPGAVIGGMLIGLIESLCVFVGVSEWKEAIVFAILIVILLVRPVGLFGKKKNEKV